jgi:hypothetical protein
LIELAQNIFYKLFKHFCNYHIKKSSRLKLHGLKSRGGIGEPTLSSFNLKIGEPCESVSKSKGIAGVPKRLSGLLESRSQLAE